MPKAININKIISEVETLNTFQQFELLETLVNMLKRSKTKETSQIVSIMDIKGLGKELWQSVDVDEYIKNERDCW